MRDATDVITEAVNGHTEALAAEFEVSTARMYQLLSTHCTYPKTKLLIRAIGKVSKRGARLIKADLDAMFHDILGDIPEPACPHELHRESFEAVSAIYEQKSVADQAKELRDLIAAASRHLRELTPEPSNGNGHTSAETRETVKQHISDIQGKRRG